MKIVHRRAELAAARAELPGPLGLVPTMGALHAGHRALIDAARSECASVAVSIFVNPTQFGPTEDLDRYPRTLDPDLEMCEKAGVDVAWVPDVADVYTGGPPRVTVHPGPLGSELEGVVRPTHFGGMLTVVAKLLDTFRPAVGYFGEKDYQQLTLIRRMVLDLDQGVRIVGVPTVREADGLALSSRNVYLESAQRADARALSQALFAARDAACGGASDALAAARAVLAAHPAVAVDYLELRAEDLGPAPETGPARLLVAARVGGTHLIDNIALDLGGEP